MDPRDDWKELLSKPEVRDARVHDARHTAGTLLIEQRVHVRTVPEILGHSNIRLTQGTRTSPRRWPRTACSGWAIRSGTE
ncbi:tyrosine-type recombinase/integrase [Nonomuraea longicatena]|uniref:tyrosine-type recombinase/integrase n=1 Tax=Nonomuraea longicatena TaxID=83682 RepID=UPI003CD08B30